MEQETSADLKWDKNELEVLMPDREITIGDETIAVREFRFLEGLKAEGIAQPILRDIVGRTKERGESLELSDIAAIFATHSAAFLELLSMATGKPCEWLSGLSDEDGQSLLMLFWTVNANFFARRLMVAALTKKTAQELSPSTSGSSSPP